MTLDRPNPTFLSRYGSDSHAVWLRWRRPMQPFLRMLSLTFALGAVSATTACDRHGDYGGKHDHHGAILSDADAAKITDATVATWQSMDASKIDALYAPDVVGFDVSAAPLSTDRANWTKLQQGFAAMKF